MWLCVHDNFWRGHKRGTTMYVIHFTPIILNALTRLEDELEDEGKCILHHEHSPSPGNYIMKITRGMPSRKNVCRHRYAPGTTNLGGIKFSSITRLRHHSLGIYPSSRDLRHIHQNVHLKVFNFACNLYQNVSH